MVVVTIDPARGWPTRSACPTGSREAHRRVVLDGIDGTDGELWAMMLDTPAMFERVVRAHAVDAEQADRIVENRFYQNIAGALSGTQEYMASEALHELHADERFDLVVVDTPPSRNALDFLEAPGVLTRFLDHKAFKLMMVPTRTGMKMLSVATQPILRAIGRIVGSDVLADAVAFFQAFAGMDVGFRERAEEVTALLHDDHDEVPARLVAAARHRHRGGVVRRSDRRAGVRRCGDGRQPAASRGSATARSADATRRADAARERGDDDLAALWANLAELRTVADAERRELRAARRPGRPGCDRRGAAAAERRARRGRPGPPRRPPLRRER